VAAIAIVVALAVLWRVTSLTAFGGLGPIDSIRVMRAMKRNFTVEGWRDGTPEVRGEMLADALRKNRFRGRQIDEVVAALGPVTCRFEQDFFPCYAVVLNGQRYQLEMIAWRVVTDIDLTKSD
jgi:hypothetical protein